jgi:hypothetical protein
VNQPAFGHAIPVDHRLDATGIPPYRPEGDLA